MQRKRCIRTKKTVSGETVFNHSSFIIRFVRAPAPTVLIYVSAQNKTRLSAGFKEVL